MIDLDKVEATPIDNLTLEKEKPALPSFTFSYPFGTIEPEFLESVEGLLLHELTKPRENMLLGAILKSRGCYVGMNRGKISGNFLAQSTDSHLLMIDTDISFQSNILELFSEHIMNNPTAHIIAGRVDIGNGLPVFYTFNEDHTRRHEAIPFQGVKQFDLVGTGIICISRVCLEAMYKHYKSVAWFFHHEILQPENREMGDDFSFCLHAKECQFPVYGAWNIFGQHFKSSPVRGIYPELNALTMM